MVAALAGPGAAVIPLQFRKPTDTEGVPERLGETKPVNTEALTPAHIWMAVLPSPLMVVIFGIAKLWQIGVDIPAWLNSTDIAIPWPGLACNLFDADGEVPETTVYNFQWLSIPDSLPLPSGMLPTL